MGSGKRKYNHRVRYVPREKKLTMPKSEKKEVSREEREKLIEFWNNLKKRTES